MKLEKIAKLITLIVLVITFLSEELSWFDLRNDDSQLTKVETLLDKVYQLELAECLKDKSK